MKISKLKAFTILEVTIVMVLSAICVTIAYTAYTTVFKLRFSLQEKNAKVYRLALADERLKKDFWSARMILRSDNVLLVKTDSMDITYEIVEGVLLRDQEHLSRDTMLTGMLSWNTTFIGQAVTGGPVDSFHIEIDGTPSPVTLNYIKHYSSAEHLQLSVINH